VGKVLQSLAILTCLGGAPLLLGQAEQEVQSGPEYGGPSLLSRRLAPSNASSNEAPLRPYFLVNGIFDNGLIAPSVNANAPQGTNAYGVEGEMGVYGSHDWRHTQITLDYQGDFRQYTTATYYNGSDQMLNLELDRSLTRHSTLQLVEMAGTFSRNYLLAGIGTLDPSLNLPYNELFDTRVNYFLTGADYAYQKSARLSFEVGGTGFLIRRQSSALYGVTGATARADVGYRLTRRSTVGLSYEFNNFDFTKAVGGSSIQTLSVEYASRLSRTWEVGLSLGGSGVQSLFLRQVTLSPEVAAILGQTTGIRRDFQVRYLPAIRARLSRDFRRAQLLLQYDRRVMPGNGVYLTADGQMATASLVYSGIHHWGLSVTGGYSQLKALAQSFGQYRTYYFGTGVTRRLAKDFFFVARLDNRHYDTIGYLALRQWPIRVTVGFGWSPGDRPLTPW